MDPFEQLWGVQPQPGPLALSLASGERLPAGMRNNNPGNIKFFPGVSYPGMVGPSQNRDEGDPQMVFDTPQNGMNAASALAMKKYSGGRHSANDLIAGNMGWTPGNTSAAANVARTMGISPDDDLGLSDPSRMQSFLKALTLQEHGPASRLYGDDVYAGIGGGTPAPAPTQTEKPMPMPFQDQQQQGPLANAMGGDISNSLVPGIFGGGSEPGYFGKLLADPMFSQGVSVLGAGLAGRDAGSALTQAAQTAAATSKMAEQRRRDAAWRKIMGDGTPDANSPILKGIPPEVLPIIHAMGPEQGMQVLGQIAMKKMSPHQLTSVAPGASLYDEQGGKVAFTAPDASKVPSGYRATADGNLEAIPGGPGAAVKLPAGYRAGPDGGLAFIPGGPADPALKVKEVQYSEGASRAANFGNMMAEAEKSLEGMAKKGPNGEPQALQNPNGLGGTLRESMMPDALANTMRSSDYQNYRQAAMQWARAKLRKESGAAISNNEFEGEFQTYFPQYGDGPEVIKQKQQARQQAQEGMIAESRGAYNQLFGAKRAPGGGAAPGAAPAVQPGAAAAQPQAPAAPPPQPGQVEDGYRFKGGNPADPNSWERMQ